MKVAILGYDVEGKASYDYFIGQGHEVTICDQNELTSVPDGASAVLGKHYLDNLDRFDLLVRTAGMHPSKITAKNPGVEAKITSHINEFLKASPTKNIIGITGTKGKGTTSTLTTKMLEAAGHAVHLGGNIGTPPLSFIDELIEDSWVVLELSSFQLIDIKTSPHIAVCLMVVPEHLDWHPNLEEYEKAKSQLFAHQAAQDFAIYFSRNELSAKIASASPGKKIPYFDPQGADVKDGFIQIDGQKICPIADIKLLGAHNWQNICAAVTAVWQATQDIEAMRSVLSSFTGLKHRLEMVRELDGVRYYDDSFGTAPETAMVAIEAFQAPEIIILGGKGKGVPFDELAELIANRDNVKKIITIGVAGPEIRSALTEQGFQDIVEGAKDMDGIVKQAQQLAEPGDVVLLSTACASFDMFKNYKDRGEQFTEAVQSLASIEQ